MVVIQPLSTCLIKPNFCKNANRTEWSPVQPEMIQVINKKRGNRVAGVRLVTHESTDSTA